MKSFSDKVRGIVRKIPKGKTMTYKEVAARAGNPKAARAPSALSCEPITTHPSHVIASSQATAGGVERKREILFEEKVFRVGK